MALFNLPKFKRRNASSGGPTAAPSPASPKAAAPSPKTLTQLERELEAETQKLKLQTQPIRPRSAAPNIKRWVWVAMLLGIPVAALWVINLPYPPIRRSVSEVAPILLLPSYIGIDRDYRTALSAINQAQQLIDRPTSAEDLALGREKLNLAQKSLDALPVGFLYDHSTRYGWYPWSFTRAGFDAARATAGRLQATVFQEENAQGALSQAEQAIATAKEDYQKTTGASQQQAIANWRIGLEQLSQIPPQTLAGRIAQGKLNSDRQDFQQMVGLAASSQRSSSYIEAARQFGWQAAKFSQNPPHSTAEWQQIETLWQSALTELAKVPFDDAVGYAEAQRMRAEYQRNVGEIKLRQFEEQEAVRIFDQVQTKVERLNTTSGTMVPAEVESQLRGIIYELEKVQTGTTVYLDAEALLYRAKTKLAQVLP